MKSKVLVGFSDICSKLTGEEKEMIRECFYNLDNVEIVEGFKGFECGNFVFRADVVESEWQKFISILGRCEELVFEYIGNYRCAINGEKFKLGFSFDKSEGKYLYIVWAKPVRLLVDVFKELDGSISNVYGIIFICMDNGKVLVRMSNGEIVVALLFDYEKCLVENKLKSESLNIKNDSGDMKASRRNIKIELEGIVEIEEDLSSLIDKDDIQEIVSKMKIYKFCMYEL